ncbi:ribosomal RNA small subunit methyltransferase A [Candidatus Kaiserbacteria bacterium]|nr:ribosomal RNA small subunit methyltransferase A [Candidatus Kaiserbacteria bacterium]
MSEKFQHKKSLGQHFLNSDVVPKWLCEAGDVKAGDLVLEIGPGTGALTKELLARGTTVHAIETDKRAIETLQQTFSEELSSGKLFIHHGDMRELDGETVAKICDFRHLQYKIIANIPYYLSGFLFRTCLDSKIQPNTLVFLVQKEVAERIARTEKSSLLSMSVAVFGEPKYIKTVKRGHFTPPPAVDSAIITVSNISQDKLSGLTSENFFTILKIGYGQKRKQLLGNLSAKYKREELSNIFEEVNIPLNTRAEDLDLSSWIKLIHKLSTVNIKK